MYSIELISNALDNIEFVEQLIDQNVSKESIILALQNTSSVGPSVTNDTLEETLRCAKHELVKKLCEANESFLQNLVWMFTKDNRVKMIVAKATYMLGCMSDEQLNSFFAKKLGVGGFSANDARLLVDDLGRIIQLLKKFNELLSTHGKILDPALKNSNLNGQLTEEFKKKIQPFVDACKQLYESNYKSFEKSEEAYYKRKVAAGTKTLKELGYNKSNTDKLMTDYVNTISGSFDVIKKLSMFNQKYGWTISRQAANESISYSEELYVMYTTYLRKSFVYINRFTEMAWYFYRSLDVQFYSIGKALDKDVKVL